MSKSALMISAALVSAMAAVPAMATGSLYTLPMVSGSTETIAFGVNDSGTITGFWLDSSGQEHGFVGPDDGSNYTSFDDPTDPDTQARGIGKDGTVTGATNVLCGNPNCYVPFERKPSGTLTDITMNGTTMNYLAQGINKKDVFTGSYENSSSQIFGYTGKNAQFSKNIKLRGISNIAVAGRGMDDAGDIVGWYEDSSGIQHGFYMAKGKKAVTIDDPNGVTNPEGINNNGEISGLYMDSSNARHGFIYNIKKKKFTELTVPNSTYVEVWGLNDKGVVAIDGQDSTTGLFIGYLYCPKATDCPSGAVKVGSPAVRKPAHVPLQLP